MAGRVGKESGRKETALCISTLTRHRIRTQLRSACRTQFLFDAMILSKLLMVPKECGHTVALD